MLTGDNDVQPEGAQPHHVAIVADPQLIDPHTYPGRPWPLNSLTMLVTDNYLRRSYSQLQEQLDPDSIFFLGDLFDGGREWKPAHGNFDDPAWAPHPQNEQKYWKQWLKSYGEAYWLEEYARFGDIFLKPYAGRTIGGKRGRKGSQLVVTLPGNHDLGFGDNVKVSVRNRFETYFGQGNRVDVIGNHTFVSVDTVSLSAASSPRAKEHDLKAIYEPVYNFLEKLPSEKQKAVAKELRFLRGNEPESQYKHSVEQLPGRTKRSTDDSETDTKSAAPSSIPELPTVLLTHVPLYRPPGTPCGPLREKWPPTKPPKGQTEPVFPDHRNAISVSGGYQYQNVLGEKDSEELVRKVGNVVHAFSGDDHDYCEIVHPPARGSVREITIKSISMAMGVLKPGFLLVSLYNPIDPVTGKPLPPALGGVPPGEPTLQTHLCLLPSQLNTYLRYVGFGVACVVVLAIRAVLVPAFGLTPFALDPATKQASSFQHYYCSYNPQLGGSTSRRRGNSRASGAILPMYKAKQEDYDEYALPPSGGLSPKGTFTAAAVAGPVAGHHKPASPLSGHGRRKSKSSGTGKWGWGGRARSAPRIEIPSEGEDEEFGYGYYNGGKWKARGRAWGAANGPGQRRAVMKLVMAELWATVWRVMWMVVGFFSWLNWRG
jgi:hypothetical protein